ncbi:MAG: DUF4190 domain-containing protein [Candidatus Dormibacteraeota bacterium]|nr:DUF4190 domain-containing protein [Candidatus Dormibacteraeota bacterium]
MELETALQRGLPIIPILVERTPMPDETLLPPSLQPLTRRNALELENGRWDFDVNRLTTAVEAFRAASAPPPPPVTATYTTPPTPAPSVPFSPQQYAQPPGFGTYAGVQSTMSPGNGIATAAGVIGIVSVLLSALLYPTIVGAPLAISFGVVGLSRANRLGGRGKGMAITGIVCGAVAAVISIIVLAVAAAISSSSSTG